ncbi:MAG: peptidylprolyl isomerase [Verrucomicrobiota bacterium]
MIGTIRKHSTWLWIVIIAAVIVTFVYWGGAGRGGNGRGGRVNLGAIDGRPITMDEFTQAQREVNLRFILQYGPDADPRKVGFDINRETYQWLFYLRELEAFGIQVDSASVAQEARRILSNFNGRVPFDPYGGDFQRFLRHNLGIQQMASMLGLSGRLVGPDEARGYYIREHQELATEAVFFSASNYLASVPAPTPAALGQYYTNEMAAYRLPDRVQVSYVAFNITNYFARAAQERTNLDQVVEADLANLGTNYLRFGKTPEEVKARLRDERIRQQAELDARRDANAFASAVFDMNPVAPENLELYAKTNGLKAQVSAPFDEEFGPREFDGGPNFAKVAFGLTPANPFAEPIVGDGVVYVMAYNRQIPSQVPPLADVRDKVTADFKFTQALQQARAAGDAFYQAATNGLAHGKKFDAVCAEAKVKPVTLPPFSLSTREVPETGDRVGIYQLKELAFTTPPGKLSPFTSTRDGGLALYVVQRLPIDEAKMKADMPAFLNALMRTRQNEALNAWMAQQIGTSLRETPLAQAATRAPGRPGVPSR